jgi:tetratricopeptide (TPR) repeat protein
LKRSLQENPIMSPISLRNRLLGLALLAAPLATGTAGCATSQAAQAERGARSAPERSAQTAAEPTDSQRRARMHYEVAIDRMRTGRNPEAIGELLQAVRLDPGDANIRLALAEAYRRGGRLPETEEHLRAALAIDPAFQAAHLNLSGLYIQLERYEEAVEHAQHLVDDPTFPSPWQALTNLGWAQYSLGRLDDAARNLRLAVDYRDSYWPARLNLGILEADRGNGDAAAEHFERVLASNPGPMAEAEVRFRLAELYVAKGDKRSAIAQLHKASDLRPSGPWGKRSAEYLASLQ